MLRTAPRAALVLVDDFHPVGRPAQFDRSIPKVILAFGTLAVFDDLQWSGLPNIDVSSTLTMGALNLCGGHVFLVFPSLARRRPPRRAHPGSLCWVAPCTRFGEPTSPADPVPLPV